MDVVLCVFDALLDMGWLTFNVTVEVLVLLSVAELDHCGDTVIVE